MKKCILIVFLSLLGAVYFCTGQQFSALEGSLYGGALNTGSQPAAAANMPYRWDVEIAGFNLLWNNNIVATSPLFWQNKGDSLQFSGRFIEDDGKRWGALESDVHVLNFLLRLPWKEDSWMQRKGLVIGAGWNLHSHTFFDQLNYVYLDSMKTMSSFLGANALNRINRGRVVDQQWMEGYITAAAVLQDDGYRRFTVGATLKLAKGISAVVADIGGLSVELDNVSNTQQELIFNYANARYGYSGNLENLSDNSNFGEVRRTLSNGSPLSPGLAIGMTYTQWEPSYIAGLRDDNPTHYDWKIEVALTDLGRLKYPLGSQSRIISGPKDNATVRDFSELTNHISSLDDFNDSVENLANIKPWEGGLSLSLPTALRINVDKYMGKNIYLNARAVLDASFLDVGTDYKTHQLSYVMLTPRWEIKRMGVYAPVYVNVKGSTMLGMALRLGPLVLGVHDFGWLFKDKNRGGGYLALVIRSLPKKGEACPSF